MDLKEARANLDLNVVEVAKVTGLSVGQITRAENGYGATSNVLQRLQEFYGGDQYERDAMMLAKGHIPADMAQFLIENPDEASELRQRMY